MIKVENLRFTYPGRQEPTIKGLDFAIEKGEIFGFLGPSGVGKSTTQNILIGILQNYTGSVQVFGQELREKTANYYEHIGVAFEFPNFYNKFTALENLNYFGSLYSVRREDPRALLKLVGIENDVNTRVSEFSKGMKMRLNFCRALLNRPDLIFLDEPTSGLDPVNAHKVIDLILAKKKEGKTIFITTHNMHVAEEICDRVAFIIDGKICLIDSPRALKLKRGKKLVRLEYREGEGVSQEDFELKNIGQNARFLKLLNEKNIETMHTQEASLEDIFIEVTGRSLL